MTHIFPMTATASLAGVLWHGAIYPVVLVVSHRVKPGVGFGWYSALLIGLTIALENALQLGPLAIPWAPLGLTQAPLAPINRIAILGGVTLLGGWLVALNLTFYVLFVGKTRSRIASGALAALLLGSPFAIPDFVIAQSSPPLRIATIQPGADPRTWSENAAARFRMLADQSQRVHDSLSTQLVVWPEAAMDLRFTGIPEAAPWPDLLSRTVPSLLAGALTSSWRRPGLARNSAILWRGDHAPAVYDKRKLVPFAEHVPFSQYVPSLKGLAVPAGGVVSGYEPGAAAGLFSVGNRMMGVLICFESAFPQLARAYAGKGASFLVTISQSGWWHSSAGARQHVEHARLRSLETGLPVLHVTVSGLSALALPDGSIRTTGAWRRRTAASTTMPVYTGATPFARHGWWIPAFAFLCISATFARRAIS
jgi:apolipoprotein N-acyltransferase